ncbi:Major Facilitator-like protein 4 [Dinothrombium tinctorium]|uniref:Major Facilitator-like protein 4 n=1 Tax=Dinothrombium tinctorium TaxID=1965070 RepID=A0A3S3NPX4_9ACAR|nr:Major Facilitator-like protein 4 [Dinothrombium tinctorium]RWS08117.1 Major Facilitator-like protein 4 [Dinothrombium tinctorium]
MTNTVLEASKQKIRDLLQQCRGSRKLVLLMVAIALLLDNMLLTCIVPIIPGFLFELNHEKTMAKVNETIKASAERTSTEINRSVEIESPQLLQDAIERQNNKSIENGCRCDEIEANPTTTLDSIVKTTQYPPPVTQSSEEQIRHRELMDENLEVGILFASKPVIQAITNPFVGTMTNNSLDIFEMLFVINIVGEEIPDNI